MLKNWPKSALHVPHLHVSIMRTTCHVSLVGQDDQLDICNYLTVRGVHDKLDLQTHGELNYVAQRVRRNHLVS